MGDKLKPGGQAAAFAGSMAAAMEAALDDLLDDEGRPHVSTDDTAETRDRRILFLAIARGIVDHLVANEAAFEIENDVGNLLANHNVRIRHDP
jgi:hypothetical protein